MSFYNSLETMSTLYHISQEEVAYMDRKNDQKVPSSSEEAKQKKPFLKPSYEKRANLFKVTGQTYTYYQTYSH